MYLYSPNQHRYLGTIVLCSIISLMHLYISMTSPLILLYEITATSDVPFFLHIFVLYCRYHCSSLSLNLFSYIFLLCWIPNSVPILLSEVLLLLIQWYVDPAFQILKGSSHESKNSVSLYYSLLGMVIKI